MFRDDLQLVRVRTKCESSQCTHIFLIRLKTPIFLCNTKLPFNSSAGVGEGWSAAHKNFRLLLLPSGPDKVHGISLRRTQTIPGEAIKGQYLICHTYYYIVFARLCQEMFHENYFRLLQKWYCLKLVKKKLFRVISGYNSYNNLTLFGISAHPCVTGLPSEEFTRRYIRIRLLFVLISLFQRPSPVRKNNQKQCIYRFCKQFRPFPGRMAFHALLRYAKHLQSIKKPNCIVKTAWCIPLSRI